MNVSPLRILLADDDSDDCAFFKKALSALTTATELKIVADGEQLMAELNNSENKLPDVLFTLMVLTIGAILPALKSMRDKPASGFLVNQPVPYSNKYNSPSGPTSISIKEFTLRLGKKGSILSKSPLGSIVTAFTQPRIQS